MTESLKRKLHDDIVTRWFAVRTPGHELEGRPDYDDSHIQSVKVGWGIGADELQSYGPHFPLVRAIRTKRNDRGSRVRLWLLNGDTWGGASGFGVATSSQQADCRRLAESSGVESIILPYSALEGASIDMQSIKPLAIDADTWTTEEFASAEFPTDARWEPTYELIPGTGYYWHPETNQYGSEQYATMDDIPAEIRAYFDAEGRVLPQYVENVQYGKAFGRRYRKWDAKPSHDYATGNITRTGARTAYVMGGKDYPADPGYLYVPPIYRHTGRTLVGDHGPYTQDENGIYRQSRQVHQLGQSVFRAAYTGTNGKRYWANFLSGVDSTPTGSGYFLVQLPKGADVSSVAAAIDSLKPETVRTAESLGIDVKRQGDLFAIPTEFNVRNLRKLGAEIRQSRLASEERRAAIRQGWQDRYVLALHEAGIPEYFSQMTGAQREQREAIAASHREGLQRALREFDATHAVHAQRNLYGTRHVGTDVAILPNGVTLARGTIRHTGGDHSMLRLGKTWHIVVRNTVPLSR